MKAAIDKKENSITFFIDEKIYSKECIYKVCYVFVDRAYIQLNIPKKSFISVTLSGKKTLAKKDLEKLQGDFLNELLNSLIRESVAKKNKKVIEQIVGGSIASALGFIPSQEMSMGSDAGESSSEEEKEIEEAVAALKKELAAMETAEDYESDILGIRTIVAIEDNEEPIESNKSKKKSNGKKKK